MIRCDQHDYLEIACLYGYQLHLTLRNGEIIEGRARDIATVERREYLIVEQHAQLLEVEVDTLKTLTVLTPGAKFSHIEL